MIDEIESEEIYDFLAQSGVKGMRWGVRKARVSRGKNPAKPESASDKKARHNRILGYALIGVGGALFTKMILDQHKTMKARSAANIYNASKNIKRAQQVNDIIAMNSGVRTSQVRAGFKVGGMGGATTEAINEARRTRNVGKLLKDTVWEI